ncbi:helix-turn-helix domain-containing protein [Microbacterium sp. No. 7]|uniref:helix-turn-helix domain-containing protein n=1 Tax=Microbacterium sp. No. 7 TaxID=1714373 RepID=UPI0009EBA727
MWEQARRGNDAPVETPAAELVEAVTEPTRRSRTPLTPHQIDAIRMARDNGESVMSIARRFGLSRMTVWQKTSLPG